MVSSSLTTATAAAAFRAIAHERRSCKRFLPGKTIPADTLKDVLSSTMVRRRRGFYSYCSQEMINA